MVLSKPLTLPLVLQFFLFNLSIPIFSVCKANSSLFLCINDWGLSNLMIKNQYLLLCGEFIDKLERAKYFIQLDLINAYPQVIRTWYSYYKWLVLIFRLPNTLGTSKIHIWDLKQKTGSFLLSSWSIPKTKASLQWKPFVEC